MANYQTQADIGNRALQHCGGKRIIAFTDDSVNASAVSFCYDKLREAELRRNVWVFSIRKAAMRPLDTTTSKLVPAAYVAGTTYAAGAVVSFASLLWESQSAGNVGNTPGLDASPWELYVGPLSIRPFQLSGATNATFWVVSTNYAIGTVVYYLGHTFTAISVNSGNAPVIGGTAFWTDGGVVSGTKSDLAYYSGELVVGNGTNDVTTVYRSLKSNNSDIPPTSSWLSLGPVSGVLSILYPVGAGPVSNSDTRNVFLLPNGFLRPAPQDPKAGNISWLGAPNGGSPDDWAFENGMLVSQTDTMLVMRFAASITRVPTMDPMFCEGLAARIGLEICEEVTQSAEKLTKIEAQYKIFMGEARQVNGIEIGPVESPEDDYILCRI